MHNIARRSIPSLVVAVFMRWIERASIIHKKGFCYCGLNALKSRLNECLTPSCYDVGSYL